MSDKPFLSIITRTCKRPRGLSRTIQSVLRQIDRDIEQVFVVDRLGAHPEGNILWANKQFASNANRAIGQYTMALDDDGILYDTNLVARLKAIAHDEAMPEVFLVQAICPAPGGGFHTLPYRGDWLRWDSGLPEKWSGNGYCTIARTDIWKKHVHNYQYAPGGDWHYNQSLIDARRRFVKVPIIAAKSMSRGKGIRFEACPDNWFELVARGYGIENVGDSDKEDWRLRLWLTTKCDKS